MHYGSQLLKIESNATNRDYMIEIYKFKKINDTFLYLKVESYFINMVEDSL